MAAIACRITAIPSKRRGYLDLLRRIRRSVVSVNELAGSYEIELASEALSDSKLQEWAALEALCCPVPEVQTDGGILRIVSTPGVGDAQTVKQLIAHAFLNGR